MAINSLYSVDFNANAYNKLREVNKDIIEEMRKEEIDSHNLQKLAEKQLYRSMMFFGGLCNKNGYYPY